MFGEDECVGSGGLDESGKGNEGSVGEWVGAWLTQDPSQSC